MGTATEDSATLGDPLPGGGPFWELAAQSQPSTVFNPASFDELVKASDLIITGRAVRVAPYEGPDELSVALIVEDGAGQSYPIRFLLSPLAVKENGFGRLTEMLPQESAVWVLSKARGNTAPGYFECTQFYLCAFIQADRHVIPAMPAVWLPGTDKATSLDDLVRLSEPR